MALLGMDGWFSRRRAELGLGLRMIVAGLLSFAVAHLFAATQAYWAVVTAVIVMQANVGGSLKAMLDRFAGTLAGAGWGAVVTLAIPHGDAVSTGAALAAALVPLSLLVAFRPAYRVAPVTAAIVLLGNLGSDAVVQAALDRVFEIGVGSVVALAVALTISPVRAHSELAGIASQALTVMAQQIAALLADIGSPLDPAAVLALSDRARAAIERATAMAVEVARERRLHLSDGPDPEPLVRTLRRVSHDLVIIARALAAPLPEAVRGPLSAPLTGVAAALAERINALAAALSGKAPLPPVELADAAFRAYAAAVAEMRGAGLTRALSDGDVERVFGLQFGLEQLRRNLDELAARIGELNAA